MYYVYQYILYIIISSNAPIKVNIVILIRITFNYDSFIETDEFPRYQN